VNRLSSYLPSHVRENLYVDRSGYASLLRYRVNYGHVVPNWIINSRKLNGRFDKIKRANLFAAFFAIALAVSILAFGGAIPGYGFPILWVLALGSVVTTALTEYFKMIADGYEALVNETPEQVRAKKLAYDSEIVQFGYMSDEFELGIVSMPRKVYTVANSWISRQNRMDIMEVHSVLTKEESRALRQSLVTGLTLLKNYNTVSRSEMSLDSKSTQDVLAAFGKLDGLIAFYEQKEKDSRSGKLTTSLSSVDELVSSVVGEPAKVEVINPDLD
jgi:hypothetical protein